MIQTARDDAQFWGLSHVEAAAFHARLAGYYARQSTMFADRVRRGNRILIWLWPIFAADMALLAVIKFGEMLGWWS